MNLFHYTLPEVDSEKFDTIFHNDVVAIKRIVSHSLKTPQTFQQDVDEYVVLVQGSAVLKMDGKIYNMSAGDTLFIPSGVEHTLVKTDTAAIWLAVYIQKKG